MLGRTVDPLGRPLDGGGTVDPEGYEPVERPRPRSSIAISSANRSRPVCSSSIRMFALGRGQRELIVGDRAIGKTAIAVDCIINQKSQ